MARKKKKAAVRVQRPARKTPAARPARRARRAAKRQTAKPAAAAPWQQKLAAELPLLGHRNWIVIADAAYPWQCRQGMETVATGAGQIEVVRAVLAALEQAPHVRPTIYLDAELPRVAEQDAPGIAAYWNDLSSVLGERTAASLPHEEIIARLDEAGQAFRVLVLKTTLALPYTSVFLQLDCGYWSAEAEARLRQPPQVAEPEPQVEIVGDETAATEAEATPQAEPAPETEPAPAAEAAPQAEPPAETAAPPETPGGTQRR